jgi:hypothetical protein
MHAVHWAATATSSVARFAVQSFLSLVGGKTPICICSHIVFMHVITHASLAMDMGRQIEIHT